MCGHPFHPGHAKTAYPGGPGFGGMAAWGFSFLVNTISKNALALARLKVYGSFCTL
jgi:hypothetical protein